MEHRRPVVLMTQSLKPHRTGLEGFQLLEPEKYSFGRWEAKALLARLLKQLLALLADGTIELFLMVPVEKNKGTGLASVVPQTRRGIKGQWVKQFHPAEVAKDGQLLEELESAAKVAFQHVGFEGSP
jgi:hypothetical protein